MIDKLLPHPWLTVLLAVVWMLLANALSAGVLVFGLIVGVIVPLVTEPFWPDRLRLRRPLRIVEYIGIVLWDILVANVIVAWAILFKRNRSMNPTWVAVPLELRTPAAISVLASTITLTPGTVSADLSSRGHALLVHCFDAPDPGEVRDTIKSRYERRLKEIFE